MKNLRIIFLSTLIMTTTGVKSFGSEFMNADEGKSSGAAFESSEGLNWNDALLTQTRGVIRGTISALLTSVPGTLKFIKAVRSVEDALSYSIDNGSKKYVQDYAAVMADYNNFNAQISEVVKGRTWIDADLGHASDDAAHGSVGAKGWSMEREGAGHQLQRGVKLKTDVAEIYALKDKIMSSINEIDAKIDQDTLNQLQLLSAPEAAQKELSDSLLGTIEAEIVARNEDLGEAAIGASQEKIAVLSAIQEMLSSRAKVGTMSVEAQKLWMQIALMGINSEYNKISPSTQPVEYGYARERVVARVEGMLALEAQNITTLTQAARRVLEERLADLAIESNARISLEQERARQIDSWGIKIQTLKSELEAIQGLLGDTKRDELKDARTKRVAEILSELAALTSRLSGLNA